MRCCELFCLLAGLHTIFCSCGMPLRQRSLLQHRGPKHHTHHLFPEEKWGQHVQKMSSHLQSHPWQISADNCAVCAKYQTYQCCAVIKSIFAFDGPRHCHLIHLHCHFIEEIHGISITSRQKLLQQSPIFLWRNVNSLKESPEFFLNSSRSKKEKQLLSLHGFTPWFPFTRKTTKVTKSFTSRSGLLPHHCGLYPEIKLIIWLHFTFDIILGNIWIFENFNIFHE